MRILPKNAGNSSVSGDGFNDLEIPRIHMEVREACIIQVRAGLHRHIQGNKVHVFRRPCKGLRARSVHDDVVDREFDPFLPGCVPDTRDPPSCLIRSPGQSSPYRRRTSNHLPLVAGGYFPALDLLNRRTRTTTTTRKMIVAATMTRSAVSGAITSFRPFTGQ